MKSSEKIIKELEAKHAKLWVIGTESHDFVFRGPSPAEVDRFAEAAFGEKAMQSRAARALASSCLVWPAEADVETYRTSEPFGWVRVSSEFAGVLGAGETTVKKIQ